MHLRIKQICTKLFILFYLVNVATSPKRSTERDLGKHTDDRARNIGESDISAVIILVSFSFERPFSKNIIY